MTGVGARALWDVLRQRYEADKILEALARCTTVVRGPKPTAVLREWTLRIDVRVPEPNTWRELLQTLDAEVSVDGRCVAVQEYGLPNEELYAALSARGADVLPVPVYRWDLPEETAPLRAAVQGTMDGRFDVLLFTSAQQIVHVLKIAAELGWEEAFRMAADRCLIASIGPTCSERLREFGLTVDMEPSHPKMGHLVREAIEAARNRIAPE
mgnify:FL=1